MVRPSTISPQARASLRAGVCLAAPLMTGLLTNHRAVGTIVALGALWGVSQDGIDRWRVRGVRLVSVALCGGVGIVLGILVRRSVHEIWPLWVFFAVMALVVGLIETTFMPAPGMYLLLGGLVGSSMPMPGRTWQPGLYVTCGGLLVALAAMLTDHRSRQHDQRLCLGDAYGALAKLMASLGRSTPSQVRPQAVFALDVAQSALSGTRSMTGEAGPEGVALRDCFLVALQIGELSAVMHRRGIRPDPAFCAALSEVARTLRTQSAIAAREQLAELATRTPRDARTPESAQYTRALRPTFQERIAIPPVPPSTLERLPVPDRIRFALLLTVAIVAAAVITHLIDGPRAFWLPLSVAFIFRPDLGPVISRAASRTAGTLVGVALSALVGLLGNSPVALVGLCAVMAAIIPWASRRSHALAVSAFTPIVFVFLAVMRPGQSLFLPRIIDTALAAAIVLIIDVLLWSHAPSLRPAQQLARAARATEQYEAKAAVVSAESRHQLRRNALRATAYAKAAIRQAAKEPHPLRRPDDELSRRLDELESRIDERTAAIAGFAE